MKDEKRSSIFALGAFVIYLMSIITIQIAWPDPEMSNFPQSCPEESINCSMIGPNSHRSGGLNELRFNSSMETTMFETKNWIKNHPRTEVISEADNQTHAVFTTMLMRFNDDFVVSGFCDDGQTVIHVYSSSRLGISDLGLNKERVISFADHMLSIEMATSECTVG